MRRAIATVCVLCAIVAITIAIYKRASDPIRRSTRAKNDHSSASADERNLVLPEAELSHRIDEMIQNKDEGTVATIAREPTYFGIVAAARYCETLDSKSAVAFCNSLPMGSINWRAAMFGLRNHPHDEVIDYIRSASTCQIPEVRWCCYQICITKGWVDLLPQAEADLHCKDPIAVPKIPEATIGEVASRYIEIMKRREVKR